MIPAQLASSAFPHVASLPKGAAYSPTMLRTDATEQTFKLKFGLHTDFFLLSFLLHISTRDTKDLPDSNPIYLALLKKKYESFSKQCGIPPGFPADLNISKVGS